MAGPSLREVQQWMAAQILPGGEADPSAVALNPQRGAPGVQRLAVYADGYRARTEDALADVYEAMRHVLGAAEFARLARAYTQAYPSRHPNLTFVGRRLGAWLPGQPWTAQLPFLPDLARLEWLVCQAFHAAEQPPLRIETLRTLTLAEWERARFTFQPSVDQLESAWPVLAIWQARSQPREQIDIPLEGRPHRVMVFRDGVNVRCELLEPAPFALLAALRRGVRLAEACGAWPASSAGTADDPGAWLGRWAQRGLLVRCDVS